MASLVMNAQRLLGSQPVAIIVASVIQLHFSWAMYSSAIVHKLARLGISTTIVLRVLTVRKRSVVCQQLAFV